MRVIERICKLPIVFVACAALGVMPGAAFAQPGQGSEQAHYKFTLASVCGDYGAVAAYGANIARALGTEKMDGKGSLTGAAFVNQPGPNNTRTITNIGIAGTYTVNPDGTGSMFLKITLPDGSMGSVTEDFVITKAKVVDGIAIATEIQDAQEQPSAVIDSSALVIHTYTLRTAPKSCASGHF